MELDLHLALHMVLVQVVVVATTVVVVVQLAALEVQAVVAHHS